MTILDQLTYTGGGKDMKKDLGDTAQYLKETAKNMASTFKQQYETNIRPRVTGGVKGAGLTGSTFLETLGFKGLAESYKNTAEEKEKNRMGIYGPSPSAGSASNSNSAGNAVIQETQSISSEQEIEANAIRKEQLDIQKRTSDDLMALYTITDDYQKEMLKRTKDMVDSLKIIAEKPAGGGGGSLLDIDLPGKGRKAGKLGTAGRLASGAKGFMAGGGTTLAAGAAMVAAPFAVDAIAGAFGYGGKKIDEEQDDKNWERASLFEKIQSAPARGLEKIGSLFGGNLANEARAERIKKETAYLDAKSGVSKTENASQDIEFNEADFAKKDPENYTKFKEFEQKKIEELIAKDPFSKNPDPRNQQMVRRSAESTARKEAINKFKKEIQAAGAGSVKGQALQKNDQTGDTVTKNNTEQKATTAASPDSGIGNKTVEQLAMDEAKKFGRSKPDAQDRRAAEMAYRKQALGGKSEGELSGVSTLPTTTATPVSSTPVATSATPVSSTPAATSASPDSGIGPKTVEQLAMDEAKRFGRSTPNAQDKQAAAMAYRKQAAGGAEEANLSGVSTLPVDRAGEISQKRNELADAEKPSSPPTSNNTVVAPNTTNVVNNNVKGEGKSSKNNDSSFQKWLDRRYQPSPTY